VGLLALTLVRLIRPLHVPSLIAFAPHAYLDLDPEARIRSSRWCRVHYYAAAPASPAVRAAAEPPTGPKHQRVAKYTSHPFPRQMQAVDVPPAISTPASTPVSMLRSPPAAGGHASSVHRHLWILWKLCPGPHSSARSSTSVEDRLWNRRSRRTLRAHGYLLHHADRGPRGVVTPSRAQRRSRPPRQRGSVRAPAGSSTTPCQPCVEPDAAPGRATSSATPRGTGEPHPKEPLHPALDHPLSLGEKPPFPNINRKSAVCGDRISSFRTFSTPVETPVEKPSLMPACRRYYSQKSEAKTHPAQNKTMDFPHFWAPPACGKCVPPPVQ